MSEEKKNPEEKVESKKLADEQLEQVSGGVNYTAKLFTPPAPQGPDGN